MEIEAHAEPKTKKTPKRKVVKCAHCKTTDVMIEFGYGTCNICLARVRIY